MEVDQPWTIPSEEYSKRRDFTKTCVFTIDPESARDLDDAVSCDKLENGMLPCIVMWILPLLSLGYLFSVFLMLLLVGCIGHSVYIACVYCSEGGMFSITLFITKDNFWWDILQRVRVFSLSSSRAESVNRTCNQKFIYQFYFLIFFFYFQMC